MLSVAAQHTVCSASILNTADRYNMATRYERVKQWLTDPVLTGIGSAMVGTAALASAGGLVWNGLADRKTRRKNQEARLDQNAKHRQDGSAYSDR